MPLYLNLGCGRRAHSSWINLDLAPSVPGVVSCDLSTGIPYPDSSIDVVYNSAMLEHLKKCDAESFVRECHRVLKTGGILRIGVPDLECICRNYLQKLEAAVAGIDGADDDYNWMMVELVDQFTRRRSGGEMVEFLGRADLRNKSFILERIGEEGREIIENLQKHGRNSAVSAARPAWRRIASFIRRIRSKVLVPIVLRKEEMKALELGRFSQSGEVHQWMYDRYSLVRLFRAAGFASAKVCNAHMSSIANWDSYALDKLADGTVIKPDLFFVEGVK
jgi:predicted SAM-dependent methyltransferase